MVHGAAHSCVQTKKWEIGVNNFSDVIYGWYLIPHRLKTIESSGVAEPQWLDTKFGRFVPLLQVNNFQKVSFVYHFQQRIWTEITYNSCHVKNLLFCFDKMLDKRNFLKIINLWQGLPYLQSSWKVWAFQGWSSLWNWGVSSHYCW